MIITRQATTDDFASIAAFWNARKADPTSFWSHADTVDVGKLAARAADGWTFHLAVDEGNVEAVVGFSMTRTAGAPGSAAQICAAATSAATYYMLFDAAAAFAMSAGAQDGFSYLSDDATLTERAWLDALGVLSYGAVPPLSLRTPLLRAGCALADLRSAIASASQG